MKKQSKREKKKKKKKKEVFRTDMYKRKIMYLRNGELR